MIYRFKSFTLHAIDGHIAELFIAEYRDKLLLLDCGCRSDHKTIVDYITKTLNKPIEQLKLLVVTHLHPDHSGSAASLSNRYKKLFYPLTTFPKPLKTVKKLNNKIMQHKEKRD